MQQGHLIRPWTLRSHIKRFFIISSSVQIFRPLRSFNGLPSTYVDRNRIYCTLELHLNLTKKSAVYDIKGYFLPGGG